MARPRERDKLEFFSPSSLSESKIAAPRARGFLVGASSSEEFKAAALVPTAAAGPLSSSEERNPLFLFRLRRRSCGFSTLFFFSLIPTSSSSSLLEEESAFPSVVVILGLLLGAITGDADLDLLPVDGDELPESAAFDLAMASAILLSN